MFEILVVVGTLFLAAACRTYAHPVPRKLGAIAVLAATFLVGYFAGGSSVPWGIAAAAGWFLLPWLDLLTRIRGLRLPLDKKLGHRYPPPRDTFPHLRQFTSDVQQHGFEHIEDSGWEWEGMEQFMRVFYDSELKQQATINLNRQSHMAFAYLSVSSRTEDGKTWTTWNYPFSYSMKLVPEQQVNRVRAVRSFAELLEIHSQFLVDSGIDPDKVTAPDPEHLGEMMERDMRDQVDHNLDRGLIKLSGNGTFRYSWRGLLYLWWQSLKDMVRLS